jgi:hypothetical protein
MMVDGACHCGAITFSAEIDPSRVVACHCQDCQILSSAPFRVVAIAPVETVHIQGEPRLYVKLAQSGARRIQAFCPECGTPLYSSALENPRHLNLRLGTLRQRAALAPTLQIWKRSALPWLDHLSGVPSCLQQETL